MNMFVIFRRPEGALFAVPSRFTAKDRRRWIEPPGGGRDVMARASQKVDLGRLSGTGRSARPLVRDLSTATGGVAPTVSRWRAFGGGRAWLMAVLLNTALFLAVAFSVVLGPPLFECRQRAEAGFFMGDTFSKCVGEGMWQRLERLENHLSMLVRGSGH
jgi:hypothetical protein